MSTVSALFASRPHGRALGAPPCSFPQSRPRHKLSARTWKGQKDAIFPLTNAPVSMFVTGLSAPAQSGRCRLSSVG